MSCIMSSPELLSALAESIEFIGNGSYKPLVLSSLEAWQLLSAIVEIVTVPSTATRFIKSYRSAPSSTWSTSILP